MKSRASGMIVFLAIGVAACGSAADRSHSTGSRPNPATTDTHAVSTPRATVARPSTTGRGFPDDSTVRTDFAMFSDACNADVREAVLATIQDLRSGAGREHALAALRDRTASLMNACPEVGDTEVTDDIAGALNPFLKAAGLAPIESADEIVA